MITIDLRDFYPHCVKGTLAEVSEDVLETLAQAVRHEHAEQRKDRLHGTRYYSLDACDWLEREYMIDPEIPETFLLNQTEKDQLYDALLHIKPLQARRIYGHFICDKSCIQLAKEEGVSRNSIYQAIWTGLRELRRYYAKRHWKE